MASSNTLIPNAQEAPPLTILLLLSYSTIYDDFLE